MTTQTPTKPDIEAPSKPGGEATSGELPAAGVLAVPIEINSSPEGTGRESSAGTEPAGWRAHEAHLAPDRVWKEIERHTFLVESHVTATGQPRSSGVVYRSIGRRLYMTVDPGSAKARHIRDGQRVALSIPVRRGGRLSALVPFPPASINLRARVTRLTGAEFDITRISPVFRLVPASERRTMVVFQLEPEGEFLTWGIGVSILKMRDPVGSRAHVPVR